MHQEDAGRLSPPGDIATDGVAANIEGGWEMGLPTSGYGNGRCGLLGGGDECRLPPEHSCTCHCNQTHYGSVSGGGAAPWEAGTPEVLGTGDLGPGGDAGGCKGGRDIRVGGGWRWKRLR